MSIEEIINSWKASESALASNIPSNPVGEELTDDVLLDVSGRMETTCEPSTCDLQISCEMVSYSTF
ncbi:hypothetical protein [Dictyobacter aurantiacus]|uniref:Mersacidin/lichenicidin family type 2 lantibiotic n=1 Tax=Dictyobacter aurantiacus TaxID=1936993 RepID=A0A401ZGG3_9CHLR|nr:hypothetical protein [Dictyobacter aurantiacus]GCE05965.1 hypothetical protein KDAU_32940 [Dictyobacter aurantiacus]